MPDVALAQAYMETAAGYVMGLPCPEEDHRPDCVRCLAGAALGKALGALASPAPSTSSEPTTPTGKQS